MKRPINVLFHRILIPAIVALSFAAAPSSARAELLTYNLQGALGFPSDTATFSGIFSYDTEERGDGEFRLTSWDINVDINNGDILINYNNIADPSAYILHGFNPTLILFKDTDFGQFGLTVDFPSISPRIAPIFPNGTIITRGFVEGSGFPDGLSDMVTNTLPNSFLTAAVPLPGTIWLFSFGLIGLIGFARK